MILKKIFLYHNHMLYFCGNGNILNSFIQNFRKLFSLHPPPPYPARTRYGTQVLHLLYHVMPNKALWIFIAQTCEIIVLFTAVYDPENNPDTYIRRFFVFLLLLFVAFGFVEFFRTPRFTLLRVYQHFISLALDKWLFVFLIYLSFYTGGFHIVATTAT